jgi:uncharacterized Ntn-hydrolase superfamily protein
MTRSGRNARVACSAAIAAALLIAPGAARATYSIVAADLSTGQVGGSGTSCVGSLHVFVIYGSAPGHGAVHAQANFNTEGRDEAVRLLGLDTPPDDIIAAITSASFDPDASRRQYGIVDLAGRSAGYTGSANGVFAADVQGEVETLVYSIQGNILTGRAVLDQAEAAFTAGGCDLADRLMLALQAGGEGGEGDSRCTPAGIPSDGAFIHVDLEDGTEFVHLEVVDTRPENPLDELRGLYDEWRASNPCPEPPEAELEAEPEAETMEEAAGEVVDDAAESGEAREDVPVEPADSFDAAAEDAATGDLRDAAGDGAADGAGEGDGGAGGCGCAVSAA